MADKISNNTIAALIVLAMFVSVIGTASTIGGLSGITGYAATTAPNGTVTLNVSGTLSITLINSSIAFSTCKPDATTLYVNSSAGVETGGTCTAAPSDDYILVNNNGNVDANVTVKSSVVASSFIGGTSPSFQYWGENVDGCTGTNTALTSFTTSETAFCPNLESDDSGDNVKLFARVGIPSDAPVQGQQTATITFTAHTL